MEIGTYGKLIYIMTRRRFNCSEYSGSKRADHYIRDLRKPYWLKIDRPTCLFSTHSWPSASSALTWPRRPRLASQTLAMPSLTNAGLWTHAWPFPPHLSSDFHQFYHCFEDHELLTDGLSLYVIVTAGATPRALSLIFEAARSAFQSRIKSWL
jgi:hypothetical protein